MNNPGNSVPPPPPPPLLSKTYEIVDDPATGAVVSRGPGDSSFVVWNSPEFASDLLPKFFKHNNFSSFRQAAQHLCFRKVNPDRWEFANEGFLRGQEHLLRSINRRKCAHGFGLEKEVERLKRDKYVLMQEIVRSRKQQQATNKQLQVTFKCLQGMELLFRALLAKFVQQQNENNRRITEDNKKRRLKQDDVSENEDIVASDGQIVRYHHPTNEASKVMLRQIRTGCFSIRIFNAEEVPQTSEHLSYLPIASVVSNGRDKAQHMDQLTQQMGLLTSDNKWE
ncbi:hypothetical protein ACJRO7_018690 [Eucalyptus globulus]|uniref:HSF-type DNA-binding domain-containing protein n=1 Tax=Eucalyptus globulus TaxID=34317 RepID=A0ABD3KUM3_EUCGL